MNYTLKKFWNIKLSLNLVHKEDLVLALSRYTVTVCLMKKEKVATGFFIIKMFIIVLLIMAWVKS